MEKQLFCQKQIVRFKTRVQVHWRTGSLGKSPVGLFR